MEILSFCAVDAYAMISGYMDSGKPRKYEKLIEMWFQAVFYALVISYVVSLLGYGNRFGFADLKRNVFPITYGCFWYFSAFFVMYLAAPMMNGFIGSLCLNAAKKMFLLIFFVFSVLVTVRQDAFVLNGGYSAIWLMLLYCLGALAKKIRLFETKSTGALMLLELASTLFVWGDLLVNGSKKLIEYTSPLIVLNGLVLIVIFSRIKLNGRTISKISPLVFGVYLFQMNERIWIWLGDSFSFVGEKGLAAAVVLVFFIAFAIFALGMTIEWIRKKAAKLLGIPQISKEIVRAIEGAMKRLFFVLK